MAGLSSWHRQLAPCTPGQEKATEHRRAPAPFIRGARPHPTGAQVADSAISSAPRSSCSVLALSCGESVGFLASPTCALAPFLHRALLHQARLTRRCTPSFRVSPGHFARPWGTRGVLCPRCGLRCHTGGSRHRVLQGSSYFMCNLCNGISLAGAIGPCMGPVSAVVGIRDTHAIHCQTG